GKADYLFGRFLGAFAVGALLLAATTLGLWLGTLMPFADATLLGPNRLIGYVYGYGLFALPNALIVSSVLFALATSTRSTAGTFVGVVLLFLVYVVSQRLMENQPRLDTLRVLADPFGMSAYMAASRYLTAAELNAGAVPVTGLMVLGRLMWVALAMALLSLTYVRFRFTARGAAKRELRRQARENEVEASPAPHAPLAALPMPRFGRGTAFAQFGARVGMEARYVLRSAAFWALLLVACAITLIGLLGATGWYGVALYPLTALSVPIVQGGFDTLLLVVATYFGGELVWREREHRMHEIVDATPLPAWALMLPKVAGLAGVLLATSVVGAIVGLAVQAADVAVSPAPGEYLRWYLAPAALDALLLAVLSVFVQALSPGKYAGWGLMALFLLVRTFGPALGLTHPLLLYGAAPGGIPSDMAGNGLSALAAMCFRAFWAAVAVLLVVVAHLLWPRGAETRWRPRLRAMRARLASPAGWVGAAAAGLALALGGWIAHNTLVLNEFRTAAGVERRMAEYEKRYFRYARLPQPVVRHVELDVALYPDEARAEVRGRYRLVNETGAPIDRLHLRLLKPDLQLLAVELPGARLESDDEEFDYRIYRFDTPMQPGEARDLAFRARRAQVGFRAAGADTTVVPNGSDLDTLDLTPRIGMSDLGLLQQPDARRRQGLPDRPPLPRLDDLAATRVPPNGDLSWTTADITVSTTADQTPVAPGRAVSDRVEQGRRTVRFVSDTPIRNYFSIQSARYAVKRERHGGVEYAVYFHPAHHWNVDRMLKAMRTSIEYFDGAFGPYQFDHARIVETPAYRDGGQAFAGTVPAAETAGFAMDLRDPTELDMVSMLTAHEFAHQWWGHQVLGARMQGAGMLSETLAQYSALMVMKRIGGEAKIRRFLQFQRDRYLAGRRTQVLAERPLVGVEPGQDYVAYGKGALAMYLLQERIGEDAMNRALRRFVAQYRFTNGPYPRSVELVAMLREEARTPADRALVTDLFERITLYDLSVATPTAVQRPDGRWDVTVPVTARKVYVADDGRETRGPLAEPIGIGLFASDPAEDASSRSAVIRLEQRELRTGAQVLRFVTSRKPTHAAVDPYGLYIDRAAVDNVAAVEVRAMDARVR
ncbi:MAG TPA: M1 family aminopeptidase, partial [Lysobacter sp.]